MITQIVFEVKKPLQIDLCFNLKTSRAVDAINGFPQTRFIAMATIEGSIV